MSINHKSFEAIYNWMNHKSLKNFCILYRDGFLFNHLWSRPCGVVCGFFAMLA